MTAAAWLKLLEAARSELATCKANTAHHYFRQAKDCPWCRMETTFPGLVLFNTATTGVVLTTTDIASLSAALNAIADPGTAPDIAKLIINPTNLVASPNVSAIRSQRFRRYVVLGIGASGGLLLLTYATPWLGMLTIGGALWAFMKLPDDASRLEIAKTSAQTAWNAICRDWQSKAGNQSYLKVRSDGLNAIRQLADLPNVEKRLLRELDQKRRELQLEAFLEKHRIDRASITHIGPGRRVQLTSYGIETAADITKQRVLAIPGFGNAIANSLVAWRRAIEARFVWDRLKALCRESLSLRPDG